MKELETNSGQEISNWLPGWKFAPAQKWSLHIPFYYPKESDRVGARIRPDLLVSALQELQPIATRFFSTREPVGLTRDEDSKQTYENTVLPIQTIIRDPRAERVISQWAKRYGVMLEQERELFTYHQPVWVITSDFSTRK